MRSLFRPEQFTATQWDSAADKAKFANQFVRFVESDFKSTLFPKWFYNRLSNTFGHIAHYNQAGFFDTFFVSLAGKIRFLEATLQGGGYGDPTFTYSDVERVLKTWVLEKNLLASYQETLSRAINAAEFEQYQQLKAKFEAA